MTDIAFEKLLEIINTFLFIISFGIIAIVIAIRMYSVGKDMYNVIFTKEHTKKLKEEYALIKSNYQKKLVEELGHSRNYTNEHVLSVLLKYFNETTIMLEKAQSLSELNKAMVHLSVITSRVAEDKRLFDVLDIDNAQFINNVIHDSYKVVQLRSETLSKQKKFL